MPTNKRPQHPTKAQLTAIERALAYLAPLPYAPSLREVAEHGVGMAHSTFIAHLRNLEAGGWLKRTKERPGFRLTKPLPSQASTAVEIRTVGAGPGVAAIDEPAEIVELRQIPTNAPGYYYARVRGLSMLGDHIVDGDVVLVREQPTVAPNEIGLFVLPDETLLVKRHKLARGKLTLLSSNPDYPPIQAGPGTVIRGKVIRVIRELE